jgi:hypothetical protein
VTCGMLVEVRFEQHGADTDANFVPVFAPAT